MLDRSYVENLVRAALSQIAESPATGNSRVIPPPNESLEPNKAEIQRSSAPRIEPSVHAQEIFRLDKRLISVADLTGHLSARTTIGLRRGTVITPSAKDWLRQRQIEIEWDAAIGASAASNVQTSRTGKLKRILLVNALTRWDAQPLGAEWVKTGLELEAKSFGCLIETTDFLKSKLEADDQTVAVVVTPHTAAALCLFNRQSNLRAIESDLAMTTEQKAGAIGANVLVLNGPKLGVFVARQITRHFVGKAPWDIPVSLRGTLG